MAMTRTSSRIPPKVFSDTKVPTCLQRMAHACTTTKVNYRIALDIVVALFLKRIHPCFHIRAEDTIVQAGTIVAFPPIILRDSGSCIPRFRT